MVKAAYGLTKIRLFVLLCSLLLLRLVRSLLLLLLLLLLRLLLQIMGLSSTLGAARCTRSAGCRCVCCGLCRLLCWGGRVPSGGKYTRLNPLMLLWICLLRQRAVPFCIDELYLIGGGTHRRRATFDRCEVRGSGSSCGRVRCCSCRMLCGVVLVVCVCVCVCVCDLYLLSALQGNIYPTLRLVRGLTLFRRS